MQNYYVEGRPPHDSATYPTYVARTDFPFHKRRGAVAEAERRGREARAKCIFTFCEIETGLIARRAERACSPYCFHISSREGRSVRIRTTLRPLSPPGRCVTPSLTFAHQCHRSAAVGLARDFAASTAESAAIDQITRRGALAGPLIHIPGTAVAICEQICRENRCFIQGQIQRNDASTLLTSSTV